MLVDASYSAEFKLFPLETSRCKPPGHKKCDVETFFASQFSLSVRFHPAGKKNYSGFFNETCVKLSLRVDILPLETFTAFFSCV